MKKNKIIKLVILGSVTGCLFIGINQFNQRNDTVTETLTIEDLVKETNFKMELKNLNELEYTVQDSTSNIKDSEHNKTFSSNNKFDIRINESGKVLSINYTGNLNELNSDDIEYLKKVYNFSFGEISTFILDETNKIIPKFHSEEYITNNKTQIINEGYTTESIILGKTSELKFTIYYENIHIQPKPYKISIDILQGNRW